MTPINIIRYTKIILIFNQNSALLKRNGEIISKIIIPIIPNAISSK